LNSVELGGVLGRLRDEGLTGWTGDSKAHAEACEESAFILDAALALKSAMGTSRIHVHGWRGDLLVLDRVKDPERQVLALLRARQLASMKCANASGELKTAADIWPIAGVVTGAGLAEVHRFADAIAARFPRVAADPKLRQQIIDRWWYQDPDSGRTMFFVPSRGIHERSGGTVSTGDTIDGSALIFGLESTKAVANPVHPSRFSGR
jgi:hypothetical protein